MSQLEAGIARRDITPIPGYQLLGYPIDRKGNEVDDRLGATALALRDGEVNAVLLSIDVCVIGEEEVVTIREMVAEATGIEPDNITVIATHTHSAPSTVTMWGWGQKNEEYLQVIRPRIVEAAVEARQKLQPVRIGIGVTHTDTGINRREVWRDGDVILGFNEWGPRDKDLTFVKLEGAEGTVAQIVHLGAHPTSRGQEPSISRDWPGVMMDRLEQVTGAPVFFINGAFGDVAPRTIIGGATGDGAPAAREVGLLAAGDAIRVWKTIKEPREADLQLYTADFEMPHAPLPPENEANENAAKYAGQENARAVEGLECNYWNAVLGELRGTPKSSRTFRQTITRIGPIVIVPFAGEVFAEIALRLKKASPFEHTLVAGTTNGCQGYFVTREARGRGGYEVWVVRGFSPYIFCDDIDDVLVRENLNLLDEMYRLKHQSHLRPAEAVR